MRTKYLNEGLVGNKYLKATFTSKGELLRLLYGAADYKQFIDTFHTGIKVNDSALIYLHDDINNSYFQEYIENTNILKTEIYNSYFKVRITQTDFVPINENVLIKKYVIKNENEIDLKVNFLAYSKALTNVNNDTSGYTKNDALIQYNHDYSVCTFSRQMIYRRQVNGAINNLHTGIINGKDYIGMSSDSAIDYTLDKIASGNETTITLFIYVNENSKIDVLRIDDEIERIKNLNVENLENETKNYWNNYVKEHDILNVNDRKISDKIKTIYNRSILLFELLINEKTGGISAGIEIDENKTKCGRYSYCWPRDAAFITEAFDVVGMREYADKFYSVFCKMTQYDNGMWEQRFYTDGNLAPSWGYQIDETASVVFGAYAHYKVTRDKIFLKENLKMFENAIMFLEKYINDILQNINQMGYSYDLWEEFEGFSLYSISAIFAAFKSMIKIYQEVQELYNNDDEKIEFISKQIEYLQNKSEEIKRYCDDTFYDNNRNSYVRNTVDRRIDMSIIGSVVPFKMFSINDIRVKNTINQINNTIRTYTGGYLRYENDGYMGGKNPWPIVTLWISWYYLKTGDVEKALECFNFVVNSSSENGFLGEQVDNETMKPCWVIGLTWSHAMYIITIQMLIDKGLI